MSSNRKRCGVVTSESAERRKSGTDERVYNQMIPAEFVLIN